MWATLAFLGIVTALVVVASGLLLALFDVSFTSDTGASAFEDVWQALLRVIDPGTMAGDVGWGRRLLALSITVFGLLVAGTLIGVIAAAVEDRVDAMRRGRSVVIESGHVVVLGTSDRLGIVVGQLALANQGHDRLVVVVMGDRDPAEMRAEVRESLPADAAVRVVYRSGDATSPADLELVGLRQARMALVLGGEGDDPDAAPAKTVLAIGAHLGGFDRLPVFVEVDLAASELRLVRACGPLVHPLAVVDATARIAAFAMQEPGLQQVVRELFDFERSDLHLVDVAGISGRRFGEVVGIYANARVIGVVDADGSVTLNPPESVVCEEGGSLVVLAEDREQLVPAELAWPAVSPGSELRSPARSQRIEHLLVVGWNRLGVHMVSHWARRAAPGSTLDVVVDPTAVDPARVLVPELDPDRLSVRFRDEFDFSLPTDAPPPSTVLVLAPDGAEPDTRVLLDAHAIDRALRIDGDGPRLFVQLRDVDVEQLAPIGADDHVISRAMGSQLLVQLADQPARRAVYHALYAPDRSTIRFVEAEQLGLRGELAATEVFAAARAAGGIAIGWWCEAGPHEGLRLNPHETDRVRMASGDRVVVVV